VLSYEVKLFFLRHLEFKPVLFEKVMFYLETLHLSINLGKALEFSIVIIDQITDKRVATAALRIEVT